MRDSILYSAIRSLFVACCAIIGIGLGFILLLLLIGLLGLFTSTGGETKLKTVNTEEIMPNAEGKRKSFLTSKPVILQINIDGIIGAESLDMKNIKQQLIESRESDYKDDRVKGVLVYINTPGGTVIDADGIYRALKDYKQKYKVPIYAYVDGLCASGGIYVASAADQIFASDVSLIGSVGVISPSFMNFTKLLDKIGVEAMTLTAGTDKDAMNPLRPWKPGEEKNYQDIVDYYYSHFLHVVTQSRPKLTEEKLVKDYGARVFSAPKAQDYGFIDGIENSVGPVIEKIVKAANIEGEYQVIKLENKGWWSSLFSESALFNGQIKHNLPLPSEFDSKLQGKYLYLYSPLLN